ncbi:hypothetical protein [Amycolatopsis tolypomycina]
MSLDAKWLSEHRQFAKVDGWTAVARPSRQRRRDEDRAERGHAMLPSGAG